MDRRASHRPAGVRDRRGIGHRRRERRDTQHRRMERLRGQSVPGSPGKVYALMKVKVSVLVPAKNEEENLPPLSRIGRRGRMRSLSSIRGARIAQRKLRRPMARAWRNLIIRHGGYPKKKNWALEHLRYGTSGYFSSMPMRRMPGGSGGRRFANIVEKPGGHDGYWINRRFQFIGKWMRHAYYPNWNLRLFRRSKGRFEKMTETDTDSGDVEIHEHVLVDGTAGRLRCEMEHYAFPSGRGLRRKAQPVLELGGARCAGKHAGSGSEAAIGDAKFRAGAPSSDGRTGCRSGHGCGFFIFICGSEDFWMAGRDIISQDCMHSMNSCAWQRGMS